MLKRGSNGVVEGAHKSRAVAEREENNNEHTKDLNAVKKVRSSNATDSKYVSTSDFEMEASYKNKMSRFSLYETSTRYYLIGGDFLDENFRVLKIDRTSSPGSLNIFEDDNVYSKTSMNELLRTIDEGNKSSGGIKFKCSAWGIMGFVRFTEHYYMVLITKRQYIAVIGGHYIYQVESTELIPLTTGSNSKFQANRNADEARYLTIFGTLDLSRNYYYSPSYNITRRLQENIINARQKLSSTTGQTNCDLNNMFVWNHYLLNPATKVLQSPLDWCRIVIHGFISQECSGSYQNNYNITHALTTIGLSVYGRSLYITIIARRSRFFAGARFLKRGVNDLGYVANDVETEQIVADMRTTSFHAPGPQLYANSNYTSYVHHRGSIPLFWSQDNSGVSPKPDIDINLIDPFYEAAALHFDNLFERYGTPIYILNLIKVRERVPRESKLLAEYEKALEYLNQSLPSDKKILYKAFDMGRASKTRGQDVIGTLDAIATEVVEKTDIFHNGSTETSTLRLQNGVARTNCIDCLDRTNAAQFVIGKRVLGLQLQVLGVIESDVLDYDTDAMNMFTNMFHRHGDTIAMQYGSSHLVNTMETYRKIKDWQSSSRDMVESFKRFYHNSFLDSQRQEAYNLFLGNYIYAQGQPMLWDLSTDYYLHHADPRTWHNKVRRSYINWYTPTLLQPALMPPAPTLQKSSPGSLTSKIDDYWIEYYRPPVISTLLKLYAFNVNSTARNHGDKGQLWEFQDLSPFKPRKINVDPEKTEERHNRKSSVNLDLQEDLVSMLASGPSTRAPTIIEDASPSRRNVPNDTYIDLDANLKAFHEKKSLAVDMNDKALMHQWTLNQIYTASLNPTVSASETAEYNDYVNHPSNLPLVAAHEQYKSSAAKEFSSYLSIELDHEPVLINNDPSGVDDVQEFMEYLNVADNPLDVKEEDRGKKRYKAYSKWLRGKSLFKQSAVDPEYEIP